ncbi:hypothetical protein HPC49_49555 [Pyxidicoccus fallax]|uniref:Uncharacterized protein n=1 Tax=Pyxidicoccus fallax TaxID=394095 RepID=A0A848LVH5_9BACT|nr:hypothetical protein [Pyxidicoccus fallax]NMO21649.1 hypothetical protein [Pyxidicoccus fallax]NPC86223.1 hypothetical protein [Pyxidicoccus fallax]
MRGLAQLPGQALPAPGLGPEWVFEVVLYAVLIVAGLALIFLAALGHKRLKGAGGDQVITIKDLFSFRTNLIGLFAVIGFVLVGGVLFMRFSDFRGRLKASEQENAALKIAMEDERQQVREVLDQFRLMSIHFGLEFPEDAAPANPDEVQVKALMSPKDQTGMKEIPSVVQPGPGGIKVAVQGLRVGDVVRLHATEGSRTWKSERFEVPAVPLRMTEEPSTQSAELER